MVIDVLFALVTALLIGVGCGLGVFLGAWVMFRGTDVWPKREPRPPVVRRGK